MKVLILCQELSECPGEYIVYCQSSDNECPNYTSELLKEENSILIVSAGNEELPCDCKWEAKIEIRNNLGSVNTTGHFEISK